MSFVPPHTQLDAELTHARERELEQKADAYARLHPDRDPSQGPAGPMARLLGRIRGMFGRGS